MTNKLKKIILFFPFLMKKGLNIFITSCVVYYKLFIVLMSSNILSSRKLRKSFLVCILSIIFLTSSFSWLYDEFIGTAIELQVGKISHEINLYDDAGNALANDGTIIYETNMSNITKKTEIIEVKNTGTLNMEYSLAFSLEGTIETAGVMYYRLYEVTSAVKASTATSTYDTKLKAYLHNNPISASIETETGVPIKNMSLINNLLKIDTINKDVYEGDSRYYRLDYGMYQGINTSLYSEDSFSVHMDAYSSQEGVITDENRSGMVWMVQNETQLRDVLNSVVDGDTIKLSDDITVEGVINITKRVSLDTNDYALKINGDLIYEFVNLGEYTIDTTGSGTIEVTNDFIINTPKAQVTIVGDNKSYDIAVNNEFILNAIQDNEVDGVYLDNVRIVQSITNLLPIDPIVLSNTRLTIGPSVDLGIVSAKEGSTNIEIINNGNLTQLNFSAMALLSTFTKPQIYVYNLGEITGALEQASIILPSTATPYLGANNGNTLIIRGITSGNISVSGSEFFDGTDISSNEDDITVVPVEGEDNSYIVYIKDDEATVFNLLTEYFNERELNPVTNIAAIEKLRIQTVNAQYLENDDFDFLKSTLIPDLTYLNLSGARVIDGTTQNRIKSQALYNKVSLETVVLPVGVKEIGYAAFYNIELGKIPTDPTMDFNILEIPSSITSIESYAFSASEYVSIKSVIVPTIGTYAFDTDAKIFVPNMTVDEYMLSVNLDATSVYRIGNLSDDRRYFVYSYEGGLGISYVVNNYIGGDSIGIPSALTYQGTDYSTTALGINSYRKMNIVPTTGATVSLPDTVISIEDNVFYGLNIIDISLNYVEKVGDYSFYDTNITVINSDNLSIIGSHAFYGTLLETVITPNLTKIYDYAFANSYYLYKVNVGNVNYIEDYAFYDCKSISKFIFTNAETVMNNNIESINIEVGNNALFSNWGYYVDDRLRVSVPDGTSASGESYINLYKQLFQSNDRYVYINAFDIDPYTYMAVSGQISEYTVKEVTVTNSEFQDITGWQIVSYQGNDLTDTYEIPDTLTANGVTHDVISIGDYAYRNATTTLNNTVSIDNANLLSVEDYAFYDLDLEEFMAYNLVSIGDYAFSNTIIQKAEFESLKTIGNYSLANISTLVNLNLGEVETIGNSAVSNDANLEQLYILNDNKTVSLTSSSFSNIGTNANGRLRIYVPNSELDYYKAIIGEYSDYVYSTGHIRGNYINYPIDYDIGEYSLREITIDGTDGWELVEYHGADLTSEYDFPEEISVSDNRLTASLVRQSTGWGSSTTGWITTYKAYITNISDETTNSWILKISKADFDMLTIQSAPTNSTWSEDDDYIYINNPSNYSYTITPGSTVNVSFQLKWLSDRYQDVTEASVSEESSESLPLISIGPGAFRHVTGVTGNDIEINNTNILNIGDYAFTNLKGLGKTTLNNVKYIGDSAFMNTDITLAEFQNVESVSDNAFNSISRLYTLDLGSVKALGSNAISNCPNLYQTFFTVSGDNPDIDFELDSINNVGSSTDGRTRFYVTNGEDEFGERFVDIYKDELNDEIKNYFFSYDNMLGTYNPTGIDEVIDIGQYSVREVTKPDSNGDSIEGYELVDYHGNDINYDYTFPEELSLIDNNLTASATNTGTYNWGSYYTYIDVRVNNNGSTAIGSWKVVIDTTTAGDIYEVSEWNNYAEIDNDTNRVTITNASYNGTIQAGGYVEVEVRFRHELYSFEPSVKTVTENILGEDAKDVISVGDNAYRYAKTISTSYFDVISDKLLYIGDSAFEGNVGLRNVEANNIVSIGDNAFKGATTFNNGSFESIITAGSYAFSNTNNLVALSLGKIEEIKEGLFKNAVKLVSLNITNDNISTINENMNIPVGTDAFYNVGTLTGTRFRIYVPAGSTGGVKYVNAYKNTFPSSVENFIYETGTIEGSYVFNNAAVDIGEYSVIKTSVDGTIGFKIIEYHGADIDDTFTFPSTLTVNSETYSVIAIGDNAYRNVIIPDEYEWDLVIPTDIEYIGDYAFYQKNIKTISGDDMVYIGAYSFANNDQLMSVMFDGVETIGDHAFYRDTALSMASIGEDVEEIGDYAFYNSWSENSLSTFYIETSTPPTIYANTFPSIYWEAGNLNTVMYVPYLAMADYESSLYWTDYDIESIGSIYQNQYIYKIINGDEVEITGFINNTETTVTIPNRFTVGSNKYNVTSITADAFDGVSVVTTIDIPRYVNNLGNGFLLNNQSVTDILVDSRNSYFSDIDGKLFDADQTTLLRYPVANSESSYTVPTNTKVIAANAFYNSRNLTSVTFPSGLIVIDDSAFRDATNITTFDFEGTVPPYITGFNSMPIIAGLEILCPYGYLSAYESKIFYSLYDTYLSQS